MVTFCEPPVSTVSTSTPLVSVTCQLSVDAASLGQIKFRNPSRKGCLPAASAAPPIIAGVAFCPYPLPSVGDVTNAMVSFGHDPLMEMLLPATRPGDDVPVLPYVTASGVASFTALSPPVSTVSTSTPLVSVTCQLLVDDAPLG